MIAQQPKPDRPQQKAFTNKIRLVTAASLFDGHDAAINLMRRLIQASGAEVIHLGHNRSVAEIVDCAIQEDVQGIAVTSYQGGHLEFFNYMYDLLQERGAGHIKIFGGGGGTILPSEIDQLHAYGIARIYSPDDGRSMGLQGMIDDLLRQCDFTPPPAPPLFSGEGGNLSPEDVDVIARLITTAENHPDKYHAPTSPHQAPVLGITGTGGAGKSSLVDELVLRFLRTYPNKTLAIISVDPSKRKTGGALLGDRIRMNAINSPRVYMRSLATRQSNLALSRHVQDAIDICKAAQFDLLIVETSGIGQSDTEITEHADKTLYVMTAEYGAATQLEKIDMLDFADVIAINKFDKRGSLDALRDVRKQYRRNHNLWEVADDELPILGTVAAQFNDPGMNALFERLMRLVSVEHGTRSTEESTMNTPAPSSMPHAIIPPDRVRYLAEIVEESRRYNAFVHEQTTLARQLYQLDGTLKLLPHPQPLPLKQGEEGNPVQNELQRFYTDIEARLHPSCRAWLQPWHEMQQR
ncbi:hypothetical protein BH09BAC4_BH09BAC4_12320 [soil metagenome]